MYNTGDAFMPMSKSPTDDLTTSFKSASNSKILTSPSGFKPASEDNGKDTQKLIEHDNEDDV